MNDNQHDEEPQPGFFKIGVVAESLGISLRTIHMYEREGLLLAARTPGGTRLFTEDDIAWIATIRDLIQSGVGIEGIRRLLALIPCWELKPCSPEQRLACPLVREGVYPCWSNRERMCTETVAECRNCRVYTARFDATNLKGRFRINLNPND
ncbi:MAG: hypothetical protein AUJ55_12800 [Proteobacteria bacterium CG1_02_64_396]|nr:MAG: hypothetical protein AUJ55_12800 [Proteobacteria bacterium CG1_02_64_396]